MDLTSRKILLARRGETQTVNLEASPHWDHAYARTTHALQGTTGDRMLLYVEAHSRDDRVLESIFGARGFYVGITRQREALTIYTSDMTVLGLAIEKDRGKSSALEGMEEVRSIVDAGRRAEKVEEERLQERAEPVRSFR